MPLYPTISHQVPVIWCFLSLMDESPIDSRRTWCLLGVRLKRSGCSRCIHQGFQRREVVEVTSKTQTFHGYGGFHTWGYPNSWFISWKNPNLKWMMKWGTAISGNLRIATFKKREKIGNGFALIMVRCHFFITFEGYLHGEIMQIYLTINTHYIYTYIHIYRNTYVYIYII